MLSLTREFIAGVTDGAVSGFSADAGCVSTGDFSTGDFSTDVAFSKGAGCAIVRTGTVCGAPVSVLGTVYV